MKALKWFVVFMCVVGLPGSSPANEAVKLDIAYVTKMPNMESGKDDIGGLSHLATFVDLKRESQDNFLFLHGGDSLAPSAMASFDLGTHMIDLLNVVMPDVYSVNEREFAFKEDQLVLRTTEAAFPFISSNIYDPFSSGNLQGIEDHQCFDVEAYNLCVFSVLDPITEESYLPDRLVIADDFNKVVEKANALREDGADIVVLMISHGEPEVRKMIESGIVDIALYSTADEDVVLPLGPGVLVKQGTDKGNVIDLHVSLEGEGDAVQATYSGQVIPLISFQRSPTIDKRIDYYTDRLDRIMGAPIGKTATALDTRKEIVRTQETVFGNMVADILRDYYGADLGLINSGGIRGNRIYQAGSDLSRKDIQREMPFRNDTTFIELKGRDILDAMENSVSLLEDIKGRFPQISGFTFHFCCENKMAGRKTRRRQT